MLSPPDPTDSDDVIMMTVRWVSSPAADGGARVLAVGFRAKPSAERRRPARGHDHGAGLGHVGSDGGAAVPVFLTLRCLSAALSFDFFQLSFRCRQVAAAGGGRGKSAELIGQWFGRLELRLRELPS